MQLRTRTATLLIAFLGAPVIHAQQATVCGVIVDAESGLGLGESVVQVLDSGGRRDTLRSDSSGTFRIDVHRLPVTICTFHQGYVSRELSIHRAPDDTLRIVLDHVSYSLGEVLVTATRQKSFERQGPFSVSVVSRLTIEQRPGSSVGASLAGTSGLFLRPYGGGAAIQTVSLRGLSSEHTLVLVDGQRLNSLQVGQVDFGLLPNADVERVEIVKGGLSALYGSDAAGGAINVITRKPAEGLSIAAAASIGSSGFSAQQLRVSGTEGPAGWSALLRQERGRGDYQFRDGPDATLLHRNGDDFRITMGDTRFDYTSDEHIHSSLAVSYLKADRGVPGSFIDAQSRATARQGDDMGRAQLTVDWKPGAHLSTMVRSTFLYSHETYEDPSIVVDGAPLFSKHLNRSFWLTPEACFSISPKFSGTLGAEFSGGWLRSSETRDATRWQQSVFLSTQYTMDLPGEIVLYPSLRYDHFTDVEGGVSPRLGMNIRILEDPLLRVRASYGTSFRVPTFNELYWKEGGNPSLKPEHSRSFDTGLLFTVSVFGTLGVDVGYFSIVTDNRIVWTPGNNDIWSPKNISSVGSEGVEAGGTWKGFGDLVVLELNSTWDRIRKTSQDFPGDPSENKLLPNIPQQTVNAALLLHVAPFAFSVQHSWVSFRFVDEINSESLPGYPLTSASVCCSFAVWNIKTTVKVEGTNIFNTSYQVIAHYPMPLREFRATLGAEL